MTARTDDPTSRARRKAALREAAKHERLIHEHRKARNSALADARDEGALLRELAEATGLSVAGSRLALEQHDTETRGR